MIDFMKIYDKIMSKLGRSYKNMSTKEMKYGLGCIKSTLDGTEKEYKGAGMKVLPQTFSYLSVMPPIRDQGATSKCVAYSLTAYLDWKKNLSEGDNDGGQFSVDKLYSIRKNKSVDGMEIKEALVYLNKKGLGNVKINGYAKVGSVEYLKQALIANGPCSGALPVYEEHISKDFWNGSTFAGGHAILIVGYNTNGFIIRNSWGKSFGKKGYIVLPYDMFNKFYEVWTIY